MSRKLQWVGLALGLVLASSLSIRSDEFHDPGQALRAELGGQADPHLLTSRRVDRPGLSYALETSGTLDAEWSAIATYRGDGTPVAVDTPGLTLVHRPIDAMFEELDFHRTPGASDRDFYRVKYAWLDTVAANQTGAWSDAAWSEGKPVRQMNALLTDETDLSVTGGVAEANHLFLGSIPAGSSLTLDGGDLTLQGQMVIGSSSEASGTLSVRQGSFTVNASGESGNRLEIGRYELPAADARGLASAIFAGGVSNLADIRFNLNAFRSTRMELVGSTATVRGDSLGGNETLPTWRNGRLVYTLDAEGVSPLILTGTLDLGMHNDHFDLVVDAAGHAGGPGVLPLVTASSITGDWASVQVTGFPAQRTLYLSHTNGNAVLTVDAPITYFADDLDRSYVRLRGRDGDQVLLHDPGSAKVSYASDVRLSDFRSHWYLQTSDTAGQYWIQNRVTGKAIHAAVSTGGGGGGEEGNPLQAANLDAGDPGHRWSFHPFPGGFRVDGVAPDAGYWTVGDAPDGTAVHTALDPADPGQMFVIEPLPRGATSPWTSYDEDNLNAIGHGARILGPTYDRLLTESEAQKRSAVLLPQEGAYLNWILTEAANAFVLRYAIEDSPTGGGLNGAVTLEIHDPDGTPVYTTRIPVSSKQAWVYFDAGMNESDDPGHGRPAKRFNEARVKLPTPLQPGHILALHRASGDPQIWIDVVETEWIDPPLTVSPTGFLDVTDFGAVPNDGQDDLAAFNACLLAATPAGKGVHVPAGRFHLSSKIVLGGIVVQGAGMWHTELYFTSFNGGVNTVGIWGEGSHTEIRDLYMTTLSTTRVGGGNAFRQYFGTGSRVANLWIEHFSVGGWIGDYIPPYEVSDGLVFFNCRIRNTFADGINFARGTRNSVIDNCHFRSTGDDSTATWSSNAAVVDRCRANAIRYNTIECTYRAAGIGVFGGEGHRIHHNLVRDVVSGAALRFNTTFAADGYDFSTNDTVAVYANSLYRSGTLSGYGTGDPYGAINLRTRYGDVRNLSFNAILIDDVQNHGVWVDQHPGGDVFGTFSNITFDNIQMVRVPIGTRVNSRASGAMEYGDVNVALDPDRGMAVEDNQSASFTIFQGGGPTLTNSVIRL